MSRLDFAPEIKEMEVTDITNGHFVFKPRPGKQVSLADLRKAITKAGYEIEGTRIEVAGTLVEDRLRVPETGQVFRLEGEERLRSLRERAGADEALAIGAWKVADQQETIVLEAPKVEGAHP